MAIVSVLKVLVCTTMLAGLIKRTGPDTDQSHIVQVTAERFYQVDTLIIIISPCRAAKLRRLPIIFSV